MIENNFGQNRDSLSSSNIVEALQHIQKFSGKSVLVKLGGSALKSPQLITSLCQDFAYIQSSGISLILIHGGGPSINEELSYRGISWEFFQGLRVTTNEMMDVIEMVLCGKINRKIVRTLNTCGVKAVGLSGSDANLLQCSRTEVKLGNVGTVTNVNTELLSLFLNSNEKISSRIIPVIAPVGVDHKGNALNVNADWAASSIAQALGIQKIIYLTDQDGILDSNGKLISELNSAQLHDLIKREVVVGGMLAKAHTILNALGNNVKEVHLINANRTHSIIEELFTNGGIGTICKK